MVMSCIAADKDTQHAGHPSAGPDKCPHQPGLSGCLWVISARMVTQPRSLAASVLRFLGVSRCGCANEVSCWPV